MCCLVRIGEAGLLGGTCLSFFWVVVGGLRGGVLVCFIGKGFLRFAGAMI